MSHYKNKSESFFREIRKIYIYKANQISFLELLKNTSLLGVLPQISFDIVPESFSYKIATKTQNDNYLFELDASFPLLDLSTETVDFCFDNLNRDDFAICLETNTDFLFFGNDREPLKVEFIDNKKLDNSGTDEYTIVISGKSILKPKYKDL